jgi:hypothetical protein
MLMSQLIASLFFVLLSQILQYGTNMLLMFSSINIEKQEVFCQVPHLTHTLVKTNDVVTHFSTKSFDGIHQAMHGTCDVMYSVYTVLGSALFLPADDCWNDYEDDENDAKQRVVEQEGLDGEKETKSVSVNSESVSRFDEIDDWWCGMAHHANPVTIVR